MQPTLLSIAYLPPVQYFSKLLMDNIIIEQHENYTKQSYRNRCNILAANGAITLTIPVVKDHGQKTAITDVRIDYDLPWQKTHFKSIESAYKNSPFYDYYIDDLEPFFSKKFEYLFEYNLQLIDMLMSTIGIEKKYELTTKFISSEDIYDDKRYSISPKQSKNIDDTSFSAIPYYQVFEDKFQFTPNLSIVDLLFNEGPQTKSVLQQCIKDL